MHELATNLEISRNRDIIHYTLFRSLLVSIVTSQVTLTHTHTHTHTHIHTLRKYFSGSACDLMSTWCDDVVSCRRRPPCLEREIECGKRDACAPHVLSVLGKCWTWKTFGQGIGHILRPCTLQQLNM